MQLSNVAEGASIRDIGRPLYGEIAKLRFIICVEASIESKHARVTQALRIRHIGPTRVSLSNRLLLLERWLSRGQLSVDALLDRFQQARSLVKIVNMLGFDRHPDVLAKGGFRIRGGPAKLHPILASIFYNCTLENMYRALAAQSKRDKQRKDKVRHREETLLGGKWPLTWANVQARAMHEHLATTMNDKHIYSCPAQNMQVQTLDGFMNEPATKRGRVGNADGAIVAQDDDLLAEREDNWDTDHLDFEPVILQIQRKKLLRLGILGSLDASTVDKCSCRCTNACLASETMWCSQPERLVWQMRALSLFWSISMWKSLMCRAN